jgi:hypothetical protein
MDDLDCTYIDFSEAYNNDLIKIIQESKVNRTNAIWLDIEQAKKLYQALSKISEGGIKNE